MKGITLFMPGENFLQLTMTVQILVELKYKYKSYKHIRSKAWEVPLKGSILSF